MGIAIGGVKTEIPAKKESKRIDFKERLDLSKAEDWCEIVKDIVAMANSGGGSILIGIKDDGTPPVGIPELSSP